MRPNTALAPRLRSGPGSAEWDGEPFDVSQGREPVERRVKPSLAEGLEGPRN